MINYQQLHEKGGLEEHISPVDWWLTVERDLMSLLTKAGIL